MVVVKARNLQHKWRRQTDRARKMTFLVCICTNVCVFVRTYLTTCIHTHAASYLCDTTLCSVAGTSNKLNACMHAHKTQQILISIYEYVRTHTRRPQLRARNGLTGF